MLARSKALCAILIALLLCLGQTSVAQAFVDSSKHWAEASIEHLGARQIINGYPKGKFIPDQNITRAEMCRLLVSMLDEGDEADALQKLTPAFSDVVSDHWARGDIYYLYELGVVTGDEQGHFNPDAALSRDEAIVMLLRTLKILPLEEQIPINFTDRDNVPVFAANYFVRGLKDGFIKGYPNQTLRPEAAITRAELAVLIERGLNYQGNQYQFWGRLLQYDRVNNSVKIALNNKDGITFTLAADIKVYNSKGTKVSLSGLGTPISVYFDLDTDGRVAFVQLADLEPQYKIRFDEQEPAGTDNMVTQVANQSIQLYSTTLEELTTGYALKEPASSIEVSKKDMLLTPIVEKTQADGRDVLVAVIDTGIDPGHPDLQITTSGQRKMVDFIDYTDEGRVNLPNTVSTNAGWTYMGKKADLSRVRSVSGRVKIGYWDESQYDSVSVLADFNGNGQKGDKVLVVAADREQAGVYDTIYVDSNGNGDIRDEMPIQVYRDSKQYAVFATPDGWGFDYVVSTISTDGSFVKFGFDSQGHGTHVAGVIGANGQMQGIAPDARLLVIKVAGSDATANVQAMEKGMRKAAEMGAQVVNISMGAVNQPELVDTINELSKKYGTLFVVAIGNNGPGLGTITDPASADEAFRVGAYVSPAQWETNYGWKIKQPTIWYFSSLGPRKDSALGPQIVAPGSVYSTTPLWQKAKYKLDEGTSMAAPHLAGGLAVLMDAVMRKNLVVIPSKVKNAVLQSAIPLDGYSILEQGYGAVDLAAAYEAYADIANVSLLVPSVADIGGTNQHGLYARDYLPGEIPVTVTNTDKRNYNLILGSQFASAETEQTRLLSPKQSQRSFKVMYNTPEQPGVYSGFITADDPTTSGIDLKIPQAIIVPYDLTVDHSQINLDGLLPAGLLQHYFIDIPVGTGELDISLKVPLLNKQYMGRVRLHVFDPTGEEAARTVYAGYGASPEETGIPEVNTTIDKPKNGIWEVVVYSTATLSMYNDDASEYSITMGLGQPGKKEYVNSSRYIVSTVAGTLGDSNKVTLQIRDSKGFKPYTGPLAVNGRMYYAEEGCLQIAKPTGDNPHIYLTWQ